MSAASGSVTAGSPSWGWLRRALPLAALLLATAALGHAGQGVARPLFVLGSAAVAWDLLRFGPGAHLSGSLVLFGLAPFLRRFVDVSVGYDPSGLMISGPLLGLLVVAPLVLARLSDGRRLEPVLWPFLVAGGCVFYAVVLTLVQGNLSQAISGALKWGAPLLYGFWLFGAVADATSLVRTVARTCLILSPLLGIYGFLQYLEPPVWDRFWMSYTSIASIGQPEPFKVRVFSTFNAPAGYATFTATALLLFGFGRARLALLLAAAPSVLGLMLSMYRTAWIGLAIGLILGLFHRATWRRATILLVSVPLLGAGVVLFTPAGDALSQRLASFGSVGEDVSGQERLAQYAELLDTNGGTLIGNGFGDTDVMQAGAQAWDGQLIVTWVLMGLVVGMISVAAVLWAAMLGIRGAWRDRSVEGLAVAGVIAGMVVQMPLAVISSSETGFLFWTFTAIGAAFTARPATR